MGYFAGVHDLRNLLALAAKLRLLAPGTLHQGDRDLYLTTAAALETRAGRMASSLQGEPYDLGSDARLHRPIDLIA